MKDENSKHFSSIKTKLTMIIMVVSALAIFITSFASVIYNLKRFESDFTKEFNSISSVIGINMSVALKSGDKIIGNQILESLRINSKVVAAYIYTPEGKLFSEYSSDPEFSLKKESLDNTQGLSKEYRTFKRNIYLDDTNIGKLYIVADVQELRMSYIRYLIVVVLILFLTLIVVYFLSIYFQRFISNPISNLARIVKGISFEKDYSARAEKQSNDEIGYLVDSFNEMLEKIQSRDIALTKAQEELEQRVAERTQELENEVNEKNRISESLKESQRMLSIVMDNIPQAIFWKDKNLKYLGCNKTFAIHAGLESPGEIMGKTDLDLPWTKSEIQNFFESDQNVLSEGKPLYHDIQSQRQSGNKEALIELTKLPLHDSRNNIIGILGTYEDITEKSKMEEELLKSQKLESLGVLAGGIAHDFNNLLTGILGNITFAKEKLETGKDLSHNLEKAEIASVRARELTNQLLTFSRGGKPVKKISDISDLLIQTASLSVRGSNIKCEYDIQKGLWPVEIDGGQISQVVNNLVINADQSMPDGGIIFVDAVNYDNSDGKNGMVEKGKYVKVTVADSGSGISEENLSKIFDPYFTTKDSGNGLGLATSYSIIRNHGGIITADSELGKGSEFSFYLPATEKKIPVSKPEKDSFEITFVNGNGAGGTVLFMDDDESIVDLAEEILVENGFDFVSATNGEQAIKIYNNQLITGNKFDLVILDLTIPGGLGGKETLSELKKIDPGVRAIVSSGYANNHIMAQYEDYGFINYLKKPYRAEDLLSVVNNEITHYN